MPHRTAVGFIKWMQSMGFEFRSGYSHLEFDYVIRKYIEFCQKEDQRIEEVDKGENESPLTPSD